MEWVKCSLCVCVCWIVIYFFFMLTFFGMKNPQNIYVNISIQALSWHFTETQIHLNRDEVLLRTCLTQPTSSRLSVHGFDHTRLHFLPCFLNEAQLFCLWPLMWRRCVCTLVTCRKLSRMMNDFYPQSTSCESGRVLTPPATFDLLLCFQCVAGF